MVETDGFGGWVGHGHRRCGGISGANIHEAECNREDTCAEGKPGQRFFDRLGKDEG